MAVTKLQDFEVLFPRTVSEHRTTIISAYSAAHATQIVKEQYTDVDVIDLDSDSDTELVVTSVEEQGELDGS